MRMDSRKIIPVKHIPIHLALKMIKKISAKISSTTYLHLNEAMYKVLAEDIFCEADSPSKPISHYDGYAVRSIDTIDASSKNPLKLKLVERKDRTRLGTKEAIYVRTGFPLPEGADTVIPVEAVKREMKQIYVYAPARRGHHVIRVGAEAHKGERLFKKSHMLKPQDITLLSKLGRLSVKVFKKPKVSLISIGDELTKNIDEVGDGKILETHGLLVSSLIEVFGGELARYDLALDDVNDIREKISNALKNSDIVVTIGGSSVGVKDLVPETISGFPKANFLFRGVQTQPGKMTGLATIGDKALVMLPGNIQSTFTGSYFILQPLIRFAQDLPAFVKSNCVRAILSEDIDFHPFEGFMKLRFFKLERHGSETYAKPLSAISWLSRSLIDASGFSLIPSGIASLKEGTRIIIKDLPRIFDSINP